MEKELCKRCNKFPILVKKRGLCRRCYYQTDHEKRHQGKIVYFREVDFIKAFFQHQNWIYRPVLFRLNNEKYNPSFYDGERNVFIEVIGSRQAYHDNKDKYTLMKQIFPLINFEVRTCDGEEIKINEETGQIIWPDEVNGQMIEEV